ncbi:PhlD [Streptomyces sp. NPDC048638]|uniref:PhlD n=1 Tax=Streptomyces sp. NPDC048638 TaxID=3365580 RepID=UPI0037216DFC
MHNDAAVAGVLDLVLQASRRAMENACVRPEDIATFVTIHATGHEHPSLADHAAEPLGLRSDVAIVPMTELACAGGAHALALAARLARPGEPVLVGGGEVLSSSFQLQRDVEVGHMGFKFLFGDGGTAAVVTAERPAGPCLEILDSWQYRLPGSLDFYRSRADRWGIHFDSTPEALAAVGKVVPEIPWLDDDWDPQFGIVHPGSKLILDEVTAHGGAPYDALRYSRNELENSGNYGGPTLLGVAARAFDDPPPSGADGVAMSFGPGFRLETSRLRYLA